MDYGKIAFYKAEELERRLSGRSYSPFKAATVTVADAAAGELATLSGSGLLIIRVRSGGGTVSLYAAGGRIGEGEGDFTVAAAASGGAISVQTNGASIAEITITAAGAGVSLTKNI